MLEHIHSPEIIDAYTVLRTAKRDLLAGTREVLSSMDAEAPETLGTVIRAFEEIDFLNRKTISGILGPGVSEIGRWGRFENVSPSPGFRKWAVGQLIQRLDDAIAAPIELNIPVLPRKRREIRWRSSPAAS